MASFDINGSDTLRKIDFSVMDLSALLTSNGE